MTKMVYQDFFALHANVAMIIFAKVLLKYVLVT